MSNVRLSKCGVVSLKSAIVAAIIILFALTAGSAARAQTWRIARVDSSTVARRVASVRGHPRGSPLLAPYSDRSHQCQRSAYRLALEIS